MPGPVWAYLSLFTTVEPVTVWCSAVMRVLPLMAIDVPSEPTTDPEEGPESAMVVPPPFPTVTRTMDLVLS